MHSNYFCNQQCEYFPCHDNVDKEAFNCLFCYCPLYLKPVCPGTPSYIIGAAGQRIRDCSSCSFPHIPANYDKIVAALTDSMELVTVRVSELHDTARALLSSYASLEQMGGEERKLQEQEADRVYQNRFAKEHLFFGLQSFDKSCVKDGYFQFGHEQFPCQVLKRISLSSIQRGYFAVFHAPDWKGSYDASSLVEDGGQPIELLTQYYIELWQNALLDAGRNWISEYLTRKEGTRKPVYVTDSFGPGFYGMPITALPKLAELIPMERAGVGVTETGTLLPQKSLVCLYLVLNQPLNFSMQDCSSCIGGKDGCVNCAASHRGE